MATTKSTVVGIRLDHERRAWVEAEAARLGVSVRGLFEGMIDDARSGETEPCGELSEDSLGNPSTTFRPSVDEVAVESTSDPSVTFDQQEAAHMAAASAERPASPGSSLPGVGLVTAIPGSLIREAFSLTTSLVELSGRCATHRLGSCVLTRRWVNRSL
jgi:hypothetical protein